MYIHKYTIYIYTYIYIHIYICVYIGPSTNVSGHDENTWIIYRTPILPVIDKQITIL